MAIFHNGIKIKSLYHNGKKIDALYHNGIKIHQEKYDAGTTIVSLGKALGDVPHEMSSSFLSNFSSTTAFTVDLSRVNNGLIFQFGGTKSYTFYSSDSSFSYGNGSFSSMFSGGNKIQISKKDIKSGNPILLLKPTAAQNSMIIYCQYDGNKIQFYSSPANSGTLSRDTGTQCYYSSEYVGDSYYQKHVFVIVNSITTY